MALVRVNVIVTTLPDLRERRQVTSSGGNRPLFSRDGRELYFMSLVTLGSMMASEIRVSGASVQREVPRILFQSVFPGGTHAGGQFHAYAVSPDGQRFLIPQFENVAVGFGRGAGAGFNAAIVFAVPTVLADRRAATAPNSSSTAPITVVLNWTQMMKQQK